MRDELRNGAGFVLLAKALLTGCSKEAVVEPLALRAQVPPGEPLASLQALASSIDRSPPSLPIRSARVEYYTGVSHDLHGVVMRGRRDKGREPTEPLPDGKYHYEFHHDADGLLAVVVSVTEAGQASVNSRMVYDEQGRPIGRLTLGSFGDFVHYTGDRVTLAVRIAEDGELLGEPRTVED